MGEAAVTVRLAARSKTVRKQRNVAVRRPILAPHHVPLRQAARIARRRFGARHQRATLVDVGRVGPAATVQHDDGGVRTPRLRLEEIGDDFGRAIGARKEHRVGQGEGHLSRHHGKHQENDELNWTVGHLSISNIFNLQCKDAAKRVAPDLWRLWLAATLLKKWGA
jgi:hypothetical protein